jgi:hypothetical protein
MINSKRQPVLHPVRFLKMLLPAHVRARVRPVILLATRLCHRIEITVVIHLRGVHNNMQVCTGEIQLYSIKMHT